MHSPSAFDRVRAALAGERFPLDAGSTKLLFYMLERPDGCDAWLTPGRFVIQYGWHLAHHPWVEDDAPRVVSWLCASAPAGYLAAGTMPWWFPNPERVSEERFGYGPDGKMARLASEPVGPCWSYGARRVWFDATPERITLLVRDATVDPGPDAWPAPIEPPPAFLAGDHPCPHCGDVPDRYRRLSDGSLVCMACGRSSVGGRLCP